MSNSDLKEFTLNTYKEYIESSHINKYLETVMIDEKNERKGYDQIGIRIKLENDIFDPKSDVYPGVIGLTRSITFGEQAYFVKKLLGEDIPPDFEIKKEDFIPKKFINLIGNWEASALFPVDIFFDHIHHSNSWMKTIDYPDHDARFLKSYRLFPISQKIIKEIQNKIIIYNTLYTKWHFVQFENPFFEKKIRLDIQIKDLDAKYKEVILRTINKITLKRDFVRVIKII